MKLYNFSILFAFVLSFLLLIGCKAKERSSEDSNGEKTDIKLTSEPNMELTATISVTSSAGSLNSGEIETKLSNSKYANMDSFEDVEWIASQDSIITIDYEWENIQSLKSIEIKLGNDFRSQIYPPKKVTLKLSQDGETYKNGSVITRFDLAKRVSNTMMNFGPNDVKKLRLIIEGYGTIKKGLPSEGQKAFTYLDDVIIN